MLFSNKDKIEQEKSHEELTRALERSSEQNRNFFIGFLLLLIFMQYVIFSTTDSQFITPGASIKLPIFDAQIPIVGFYLFSPIFILALHFNFIQNIENHHFKLLLWEKSFRVTNGDCDIRSVIFPFFVDYAFLNNSSYFSVFVGYINQLFLFYLAPFTIALLLIRFSDFQEFFYTLWHFIFFTFDFFLVWQFRRAISLNKKTIDNYAANENQRSKLDDNKILLTSFKWATVFFNVN